MTDEASVSLGQHQLGENPRAGYLMEGALMWKDLRCSRCKRVFATCAADNRVALLAGEWSPVDCPVCLGKQEAQIGGVLATLPDMYADQRAWLRKHARPL